MGLPLPRVVRNADVLRELARRATELNAPQLPLIKAAAAGDIALASLEHPLTPWPHRAMKALRGRPAVMWVQDDWAGARTSAPPTAWRAAQHIRRWASAALVHGAAGAAHHYAAAVGAALGVGRVVVIDTSSAVATAWAEYLAAGDLVEDGLLLLLPSTGAHPLAPERMH